MSKNGRFLLEVECLEERLPLSGDMAAFPLPGPMLTDSNMALVPNSTMDMPVVGEPTTSEITSPDLIDPTEDPIDPNSTTVTATVTGLGGFTANGNLQSIDVSGVPNDLASFPPTLVIGNTSYEVEFVIPLDNGQYRLVVIEGINPQDVSVGMQVTLVYGDGGSGESTNPQTPTPSDPVQGPSVIPLLNPDGSPAAP